MKTACIYHSIDLDGWMSAAIVKHWFVTDCDKKKEYFKETNQNPTLDFIGYNYGQPIPDLSEYDKIIMCDISFPKEEMIRLSEKHRRNFIWIDHHVSAIKDLESSIIYNTSSVFTNVKFAACELTWKFFFPNETMPEIVRLLGRYDCFGHKQTNEEQIVLEFQYGARQCISNYGEAYDYLQQSIESAKESKSLNIHLQQPEMTVWINGCAIYQYLYTEAKQVYKNGFEITFDFTTLKREQSGNFEGFKFICINKERFNPINFGIDYHSEGYDGCACFHYDGVANLWRFSLYNDNGEVDCSIIAKDFGGGGHRGASGFVVKDINNFFENCKIK